MKVRFYFDFISPYSYLASALLEREPLEAEVELRPVVFGTILSKLGVKGPGEIPARRAQGLADVLLLAAQYGIPLEGPPAHPFNSLYALRSVAAVEPPALRLALMHAYFRAAWAEGKNLEDPAVLRTELERLGIAQDPEVAATSPRERASVRASTAELLGLGGWGVPAFVAEELLFFGHDRLPLLRAFLRGDVRLDRRKLDALLARPQPGRIT